MKAPSHSPLPWSIEEHAGAGDLIVLDADGEIVAEPDYRGDARLIVAAVNSNAGRAELLAAAKAIYEAVHGDTVAVGPLWGRLYAAIAKAEAIS